MAILEFLAADANDQGNFPKREIVSPFFWCEFQRYIILYIFYILLLLLVQTFLFRFNFKFEGEKLITLGVDLRESLEPVPAGQLYFTYLDNFDT